MKVFISADIEGITTTTFWPETEPENPEYKAHADQMTKEVQAACQGALEAGATEIVVRDAHGYANNIDIHALPKEAKLIRGWSGHPYMMVFGIDHTFDAAVFIGYHSAASKRGNPMSHTESLRPLYVKINGRLASEFMLFSYAAALEKVPTVFLSGDKQLCEDSKDLHPGLITCPVKEGFGEAIVHENPVNTLKSIKSGVCQALDQNQEHGLPVLPDRYEMEICYKDHVKAEKFSYFPGVERVSDNTIRFITDDYFELLRVFSFVN